MSNISEAASAENPEQAPRQLELEQAGAYSQYLLHSRSEILSVLRSLLQKGALITIYFDQGRSFLLTSLIDLQADKQGHTRLIFDVGSDDEMNRRALRADKLIFTTSVDKVKVQFRLASVTMTEHGGRPAFAGGAPDSLLRLQRREYYRLSTPIAHPILLTTTCKRADGSTVQLQLPLLDISGGGVGLMLTIEHGGALQTGDTLEDCHLELPDEGLLKTTLCVRNLFEVTTRSGSRYLRAGCEYSGMTSARLSMVQRYITRIERERKAKLNGLR